MKGKIDGDGFLHIYRGPNDHPFLPNFLTPQECMHDKGACGDWCPQFGEPIRKVIDFKKKRIDYSLKICQNRELIFDEWEDER